MSLEAVVYTSRVSKRIDPQELQALVSEAEAFNSGADVSSVLLFDGGRFLQYLEGPARGLTDAYGRVRQASRHTNIIEVAKGVAGKRLFRHWPIKRFDVDSMVLGSIARADWSGFLQGHHRPGAVDHLLDVVNRWLDPA